MMAQTNLNLAVDACRQTLAHFKFPISAEFREELDRKATGKYQQLELRELNWAGCGRRFN